MDRRALRKPRVRTEDVVASPTPLPKPAANDTLAGEVLRLQRLVGNTAVTSLIARAPLQRDKAPPAKDAPGKEREETAGGTYTMTMSEIGSFDLLSFSSGGTGGGQEREKRPPQDMSISKKTDEHSAKLMQRAAEGKPIATVEIVVKQGDKEGYTIKLKNVYIASFQQDGGPGDEPVDTFTINAESMEFEYAGGKSEGGAKGDGGSGEPGYPG